MKSTKKRLRIESSNSYDRLPPKGATIKEKNVSTTVDEIENGFIVSKNYSGRYSTDKESDMYFDYSKKWFAKENPLTINMADVDLAEEFEKEED